MIEIDEDDAFGGVSPTYTHIPISNHFHTDNYPTSTNNNNQYYSTTTKANLTTNSTEIGSTVF